MVDLDVDFVCNDCFFCRKSMKRPVFAINYPVKLWSFEKNT